MPVIAIIAIVIIVIILNKTGVSDSLTALTLATVAALLTGGGAAGAASVALTPFVGVPVGIFVGIYVFAGAFYLNEVDVSIRYNVDIVCDLAAHTADSLVTKHSGDMVSGYAVLK